MIDRIQNYSIQSVPLATFTIILVGSHTVTKPLNTEIDEGN